MELRINRVRINRARPVAWFPACFHEVTLGSFAPVKFPRADLGLFFGIKAHKIENVLVCTPITRRWPLKAVLWFCEFFLMYPKKTECLKLVISVAGWPHSSQNEIRCVFPEFSLCYINFPCVIFMQKLTIISMNKGHITTVLLHTEAYKLIF